MSHLRVWRAATIIAVAALVPATHGLAAAAPAAQPSADGELIAEGVVGFTDGTFHWQVVSHTLTAPGGPVTAPEAVTFVLAGASALQVEAGDRTTPLAAGGAVMLDAFSGATISATGTDAAFWTLSLADVEQSGGRGTTGGAFTMTEGHRTVELVRYTIDPEGELTVPDDDVTMLVMATDGAATLVTGDDTGIDLVAGDATTYDGEVTLVGGDLSATVVVAVIGEPATAPSTTAARPAGPRPTEPRPTAPTDTTPPETTAPATDTDGDGLPDDDETGIHGTDPTNPDTDGDHVNDGDEVNAWGTDPLANNSDGDSLTDGDEVNITHTDPTDTDTDDDGLDDGDESPRGTDPNDADSDDDGANDGDEVAAGTDPLDPASIPS